MRRPVPISTRLPPALQLKSVKHRALVCGWNLGLFPVHYRYLSSIGLQMYLDDLRSLSQKKVSNLELRKIRIALTVLSSIPELDSCTAVESWVIWRLPAYLPRRSFFAGINNLNLLTGSQKLGSGMLEKSKKPRVPWKGERRMISFLWRSCTGSGRGHL